MSSFVPVSPTLLQTLLELSSDALQRKRAADAEGLSALESAVGQANILLNESKEGFSDLLVVPKIATCHISLETNNRLMAEGDSNPWCYCGDFEFGFWLSVPSEDSEESFRNDGHPAPADLVELWKWARKRQYGWILLDSDGSDIDGLPTYDW